MRGRGDDVDLAQARCAPRRPARSAPSRVPGGTTFGKMRVGRPNFFSRPVAQLRVSGFRHWEVEAMVNSATREPHSAQWMKSGMKSRQSAASSKLGRGLLLAPATGTAC